MEPSFVKQQREEKRARKAEKQRERRQGREIAKERDRVVDKYKRALGMWSALRQFIGVELFKGWGKYKSEPPPLPPPARYKKKNYDTRCKDDDRY